MTDSTELKPTPGTLTFRGDNEIIAFPGLNDSHIVARFYGPDAKANRDLVLKLWNTRTEPESDDES